MTVFVICLNDWPKHVYQGNEAGANAKKEELKALFEKENPRSGRGQARYWHLNEVPLTMGTSE